MARIVIEEEQPPNAKELRSAVKGLEGRLSDAARRGDRHGYQATVIELRDTKTQLAAAERRELAEAAAAARLKANRARTGMAEDGSLASQGYDSPAALVADRLRRGPLQIALEQAGLAPRSAA